MQEISERIYMDYAAATPVDPRVVEEMAPYWHDAAGNPGSLHDEGRRAATAVASARRRAAKVLECSDGEIIFTAGATEANNTVLRGLPKGNHIVVSAFEHPSIANVLPLMETEGYAITRILPDVEGRIGPEAVRAALRSDTVLVSVIHAHNEIGVIQPISKIAHVVREFRGKNQFPYIHTDACQSPVTLSVQPHGLGVDLMTISGQKVYGPKGIGVLYIRKGIQLRPLILGGGQEDGMRSGTENVPAIVGFAAALEIAASRREDERARLAELRDYCFDGIIARIENVEVNGSRSERLAGNINVSFLGTSSEQLVIELDVAGIAASAGSACDGASEDGSLAVRALGKGVAAAESVVRFSFGVGTTRAHVDRLLEVLPPIVQKLRRQAATFGGHASIQNL